MGCIDISEKVFNGTSNTFELIFGLASPGGATALYDFTVVTRIVLELYDSAGLLADTVDSDISPAAIDYSLGNGEVSFELGSEAIPVGTYNVVMTAFAPLYALGYLFDSGEIHGSGDSDMSKLTGKQQLFVDEYLKDMNATQAAILAGYSKKTAQQVGSENLLKPVIAKAIGLAGEGYQRAPWPDGFAYSKD